MDESKRYNWQGQAGLEVAPAESPYSPKQGYSSMQFSPADAPKYGNATYPDVRYSQYKQPEVYATETNFGDPQQQRSPPSEICGLRKRTFWIIFGVVLFVVIAGAVGGGVGGSLASKSSSHTPTPTKPTSTTSYLAPSASPPAGCSENYHGTFELEAINITNHRSLYTKPVETQTAQGKYVPVKFSLTNGTATSLSDGAISFFTASGQLNFGTAPPAGPNVYTAGFSICYNSSFAFGGSAVFYQCVRGQYDDYYSRPQTRLVCDPILMRAILKSGASSSSFFASSSSFPVSSSSFFAPASSSAVFASSSAPVFASSFSPTAVATSSIS